jgi:hypothetical protein
VQLRYQVLPNVFEFHHDSYYTDSTAGCIFLQYRSDDEEGQCRNWYRLCKIWGFRGGDYEKCRLRGLRPCGSCKIWRFSETSVRTRDTLRHIPEDDILQVQIVLKFPSSSVSITQSFEMWIVVMFPGIRCQSLHSKYNVYISKTYSAFWKKIEEFPAFWIQCWVYIAMIYNRAAWGQTVPTAE